MFISIETAIVSAIPIFTELMPKSRAVMMSANMGVHSLGRVTGAALGALIYGSSGGNFFFVGLLAAGLGVLGFFVMWRLVPHDYHDHESIGDAA